MGKKTQIHIQVDERRKKDWNELAGERSLSHTIRKAMSELMAKEKGDTSQSGGLPPELEDEITTTNSNVKKVQDQLTELSDRFEAVESQTKNKKEIRSVAYKVYGLLPTKDQIHPYKDAGSIQYISMNLSEPKDMVEKAINQLMKDTYDVHEREFQEKELEKGAKKHNHYYYKEDYDAVY